MDKECKNPQCAKRLVIKLLVEALNEAHKHLEYCEYGDLWERKCAVHDGLDAKIRSALDVGNKTLERVE